MDKDLAGLCNAIAVFIRDDDHAITRVKVLAGVAPVPLAVVHRFRYPYAALLVDIDGRGVVEERRQRELLHLHIGRYIKLRRQVARGAFDTTG